MKSSDFLNKKQAETEFYKQVGSTIRHYRLLNNITLDELGFILGVSRVAINTIELGKQRLPLHLYRAVESFLHIPNLTIEFTHGIKTVKDLIKYQRDIAISKIEKSHERFQ